MSVPPDQFARLRGLFDVAGLAHRLVVVIGVGAVGSQVAKELADHAVGRLRLIDPSTFAPENRLRHALPVEYFGWNKAEGMAVYLADQVAGLRPEALRRSVDASVSDDELDSWLRDADLIIAATDEREAQRRIGRRGLALDIPVLFPGIYEGHGGEVFLQRSPRQPCFLCWDGFRPADQAVRGAAGGNADVLEIVALTTQLSLGILDHSTDYLRRLLAHPRGSQPPQLFVYLDHTLGRLPVRRGRGCQACAVGPARTSTARDRPSVRPPTQPPVTPPNITPRIPPSRSSVSLFAAVAALVIIVFVVIASSSQNTTQPSATTPEATGTASTPTTTNTTTDESPSTTSTEPQLPSPNATTASLPGTSVATALPITPGRQETGNSGTVAYGNGNCGPEKGQFWKVALKKGQEVTIEWRSPNNTMGLDVWPPGITDIHGSDGHRLASASAENETNEIKFVTPTTGEYPIVIDDNSCGHPGPFYFTLGTRIG